MTIIGQHRVISQLEDMAWAIKLRDVPAVNILLRSPPGYGKTNIARYIAKQIDSLYVYQQVKRGGRTIFDSNTVGIKVQIVDEIHLDMHIEDLYSFMDSGKYVFIFCTTDSGLLPDAFISRCFSYTLDEYTVEELGIIVYQHAEKIKLSITKESSQYIGSISRGCPRTAISITDRIKIALVSGRFENTLEGIISAAQYIGISNGGYTDQDRLYLELVQSHGCIGLNNICRILRIDRDTVVNVIEPFLLSKNRIYITSRGRVYNG